MKYYVLFGPPGAGKGTQASAMVERYNLHHISTGALLRKEIAAETELGKQARELIDKGCLVPDEVVEAMIVSEFDKMQDAVDGFLLDGYPRTLDQARSLDRLLAKKGEKLTSGGSIRYKSHSLNTFEPGLLSVLSLLFRCKDSVNLRQCVSRMRKMLSRTSSMVPVPLISGRGR